MRIRTAAGIAVGIIVAKGGLTWLALHAWGSLPERPSFVGYWRIQLGSIGEWLAAFAAAGAALVALYIAGRERHHRAAERNDEERTLARLVQLEVTPSSSHPAVEVKVRNFGPLPVLDVDLVGARWSEHPEARWKTLGSL